GTLVPMIGLVQVGRQSMADRYAYLPLLGLFVMICWGVADWTERWDRSKTWLFALSAVGLLALAVVAHRQISYWGNNVTLWSHAVQVTGENFIAEDKLVGAFLEQGHIDEAIPHFRAAAAIEPSDPMSHLNIAADEQRRGNLPQA